MDAQWRLQGACSPCAPGAMGRKKRLNRTSEPVILGKDTVSRAVGRGAAACESCGVTQGWAKPLVLQAAVPLAAL